MPRNAKKTETLADAESVKMARKQRWNPLRQLSPTTLTRALDAFEYGDLREFAMLADVVAERDDTIKSVKPKREKSISRRDWNVMKREKSAAADRHAEVLNDFWENARAENAYDRNERGGMSRLIKQMMTSVSFKYACHHIVWKPEPGKLRAVFEFVPLWFFENRTGRLRFVKDGVGVEGEEMDPREWMVTTGDGLMIACLIGYLAKRHCIQDWLAFSEKFSMPGTLGRTSAAKGSDAGKAMRQAVESFGQDWAAVIYGDDGNSKIELVQPNGNPSAMPMPALIERVDRKMAALYRGADLSSMSSKDGEGTGASLQSEETDILEADDCEVISETLQEVEREVIAWHFGKGVEPLAYIKILPPVREDKKFVLEAGKALVEAGVRVSKADYLDRLGFAEADADEEAIGEKAKLQNSTFNKEEEANAGGWRTMEGGQKVYIEKLKNPTKEDRQGVASEKQSAKSEKKQPVPDKNRKDWDRWDHLDYDNRGKFVKPFKEDDLKKLLFQKVELPDGTTGEVASYNFGTGFLTVNPTEQDVFGAIRIEWNRVKPINENSFSEKLTGSESQSWVFRDKKTKAVVMETFDARLIEKLNSRKYEAIPIADYLAGLNVEKNGAEPESDALRTSLAADLQPLGDALYAASQAGDMAAVKAALRRISKDMPEFMASDALAELIGEQMMEAISEA